MLFVDSYFRNRTLIDTENCLLLQIFCCKVFVKGFDMSYPLKISTFNADTPVSQRTKAHSNQMAPKCCAKEPGLLDIRAEKEGKDLLWSKKRKMWKTEQHDLICIKPKQNSTYPITRDLFISAQCVSPHALPAFCPRLLSSGTLVCFRVDKPHLPPRVGGWLRPGGSDNPMTIEEAVSGMAASSPWGCWAGDTTSGHTTSVKKKPKHRKSRAEASRIGNWRRSPGNALWIPRSGCS